ncbi:group II intron reverse transcriptase/maturase [Clostridium perfringens]|uniref:group II intron reverse transcriptase/maturase n=1 Tax=Clostridium perfringens TaxID=1502 RepID=UPI0022466337|nr:group II intron reverse transcriptase/maturase [Clostridium perfringens]MCX0382701.1 group II intron reverse transcriptase/maturase [Clostridium perfringens]
MATKSRKKQKLRNNEYYNTQEMFDDLYNKSKNKKKYKFYNLMDLITSKQNIELAYRNIKRNTGSKTTGTNGHDIEDLEQIYNKDIHEYVKNRLMNYKPHEVRRVEIPKSNGTTRALGIPTIEDRLIQQCIKQILEPICEAKFYSHNYGFRPNRSTKHAIARANTLANRNFHFVVDIDIKGFFDNVNHGKLLKQMWSLGIRDKRVLSIISKMLKAPIKGIGIPEKGTPQGGILSPLLSNIVLNELDWWIANQWEFFKSKHQYGRNNEKYRALRKTKLKEIFIVRYADDFKLICKNYKTAKKIFHATTRWLKERLKLEISQEKSKIINLRKNYSEYLGFKMKVRDKNKKKVVKSSITDKAKKLIIRQIKEKLKNIKKETTVANVNKYNSKILGLHNYYNMATNVNLDFNKISYALSKTIYNSTNRLKSNIGTKSKCFEKFYGRYNCKIIYIQGVALFPITGVKHKTTMNYSQTISDYTKEGRKLIHKRQQCVSTHILKYIMNNPIKNKNIEYNDNRISLYVGQNGKCNVSGEVLEIGNMECHHKIPKKHGGTDEYSNLVFLKTEIHKLIHVTQENIINNYLSSLKLNKKALKKLNKLRVLVGNFEI